MRLLVAEDQSMLRDALCQLLQFQEDVTDVFQAENGKEAQLILKKEIIDVAILDIEMPEFSGLDILEWIKKEKLETKVIIVTTFKRSGYFGRAIKSGVDGYVLKDRSIAELMKTINQVLAGKKEYSPELIEQMIYEGTPLSTQEERILEKVSQGFSNKEIANQLFLSNGTVRNYMSQIMQKLDADNRTEAVHKAQLKGWL